jgi:hypothetical protein
VRSDRPDRPSRPWRDDDRSRPGAGRPGQRDRDDDRPGSRLPEDPRRAARRLPVDPDVDPRDLDPGVRAELRSLSKETAERVARHLVSAGTLVDEDPEQALAHARAARALAGRVASVREAVGVAAYRAGEFGEALAEFRAARRISGRDDHLPVMADCERALGRPDRALALIASPAALRLDPAAKVELRIVESGVRRDLGQHDAAVLTLQGPDLDSTRVEPWTPRLWYAYAAALADAGRREEALRWFTAVSAVDDGETDADERVAVLEAAIEGASTEGQADPPAAEPVADGTAAAAPEAEPATVPAVEPVQEAPAARPPGPAPLLFSDTGAGQVVGDDPRGDDPRGDDPRDDDPRDDGHEVDDDLVHGDLEDDPRGDRES